LLYLLDANVLITASRTYYGIERVPEFWDWLAHMGKTNNIKIPQEVYEEFKDGNDALAAWAKQDDIESVLLLNEPVNIELVRHVTKNGYASDLTDDELEKLGRDPFLIAYGLKDAGNRTVVTTEVSKPKRIRANRHMPDVCVGLKIPCCNTFDLTTALNFRTGWNR